MNKKNNSKIRNRKSEFEINAVLSFGYVIVGAELQSLLDGIGFDPYLGFYHATSYGRPSLALDLVEEFRHSFIDHLAIQVFNQGIFSQDDFSRSPEGGVLMNTAGKKKFFQYYEKMAGKYSGAVNVESKGFRSKYQSRIHQMMKLICGDKTIEAVITKAGEDFDSE